MKRLLLISAFLLIVSAAPTFATGIWPSDKMPPLNDDWAPRTTDPVLYVIGPDRQAKLKTWIWSENSEASPVPPLGATYNLVGSFFDVFVELEIDGTEYTPTSPGQIEFSMTCISDEAAKRIFNNELLRVGTEGAWALYITDDIALRESPTIASTGQTTITNAGSGYHIDSFFDVFTELSIDGGQTWTPSNQPIQIYLYPEPATVLLLGLGGLALLRKRRT